MPLIIDVDDPADVRLEPYRDVRERDLVGRDGLFLAEGRVVIEKLVGSQAHRLDSLFVARQRLDSVADLLARLPARTPVLVGAQNVVDAVAGFALHRGLIAVGRRGASLKASELLGSLPEEANVVVLSGIANHDNMGGIFRNSAAFGVQAVLLTSDCCDPLYRKAIRVSVGAALLVPFVRLPSGADALSLLGDHGFQPIALSPAGKIRLADLRPAKRNAVLLGAEGPGLPQRVLERATTVRIPMANGFDSVNVATTSGIVLHHLVSAVSASDM